MATVTSPVSLSKIQNVFGGSGRLSQYYRGGLYVPDTPANSNIATSASGLRISQFLGASDTPANPYTIKFSGQYLESASYASAPCTNIFRIAVAGKLRWSNNTPGTFQEIGPYDEWMEPEDITEGQTYECRGVHVSGTAVTASGGALDLWRTPLRDFTLQRSVPGRTQGTFRLEIRKKGTTTVLASANVFMAVQVNTGPIP